MKLYKHLIRTFSFSSCKKGRSYSFTPSVVLLSWTYLHRTNTISAASQSDRGCWCPTCITNKDQRPAYLLFRKTPALLRIPGEEAANASSCREREQSTEKHSTAQLQVCWGTWPWDICLLLMVEHSPGVSILLTIWWKSQGFQSNSRWQWWFLFALPLSEDKHEVFVYFAGFFLLYLTLPLCEGQKPDARNVNDSKPLKEGISHKE